MKPTRLGFIPLLAVALIPALIPVLAVGSEGDAERSLTRELVEAFARQKAPAMIGDLKDGTYEAGKDEWFKEALAVAVLRAADSGIRQVPDLDPLWAETARTDQQVGSGALAPASTTLTERPGLPRLLAIGVERGAIEQESDDTSTTLSTSPYALMAMLEGGDSAANYQRYKALTLFNFGGTALIDDQNDGASGDLEYEDFAQAFLKVRLWGDRSARNAKFVPKWEKEFGGVIDEILAADTKILHAVINNEEIKPRLIAACDRLLVDLRPAVESAAESGDEEPLQREFAERVLAEGASIAAATDGDSAGLAATLQGTLEALAEAYSRFAVLRTEDINAKYDDMLRELAPSVMSLKYTLNRAQDSSDFSELSVLFQHDFASGNIVLNGGVSLFHEPGRTAGGETIRDFSFAATIDMTFANSFLPKASEEEAGPISLSASVRASRNEEINDEIITAQAKLEIPFAWGLRLPIALTYANRTLDGSGDDFRVNAGFLLNGDQLFDLMKLREIANKLK